jgi:Fe-S-cluster containining protein
MSSEFERTCGDCKACCSQMPIAELGKPAGVPCSRLCTTGCGDYENRPATCKTYGCMWLYGMGRSIERPDRVGYFLNRESATSQRLVAVESWPGAFDERLVQDNLMKLGRRHSLLLQR